MVDGHKKGGEAGRHWREWRMDDASYQNWELATRMQAAEELQVPVGRGRHCCGREGEGEWLRDPNDGVKKAPW